MKTQEERQISYRAAVARYYRKHIDVCKQRYKVYRDKNKEKLKAYQAAYRLANPRPHKIRVLKPKAEKIRKPRPTKYFKAPKLREKSVLQRMQEEMSKSISCEYCELTVRKGSDEYFDGILFEGEFRCGMCKDQSIY